MFLKPCHVLTVWWELQCVPLSVAFAVLIPLILSNLQFCWRAAPSCLGVTVLPIHSTIASHPTTKWHLIQHQPEKLSSTLKLVTQQHLLNLWKWLFLLKSLALRPAESFPLPHVSRVAPTVSQSCISRSHQESASWLCFCISTRNHPDAGDFVCRWMGLWPFTWDGEAGDEIRVPLWVLNSWLDYIKSFDMTSCVFKPKRKLFL